jgi:flagellar FliJ protein
MQRKENLQRSADDLRGQLNDARGELEEAFEELKKFEILDDREHARDRATEAVRDQAELDRVALTMRSSFARA